MEYLFILGRNVELSVAELESFFRKNNRGFEKLGLEKNGLLISNSTKIGKGTVAKLGGTVSIGEVLASGNAEKIFSQLGKIELHSGKSNKLNYVVHDFNSGILEEAEVYLKQRFKAEKLKATEKKLTGNIKLQGGESVGKVSSRLIDEEYFTFSANGKNFFGRIIENSDYDEIEKRDMEKPVRRNELAISPRLAKILINLSEVREGETLLDPFCGIGVVLQEALLQKIKVIGIDLDKTAIRGARQNLEFFGFDKKHYTLINGDSSKIELRKVGKAFGIATEPDLGELQKKVPSEQEARKIIEAFEQLMIRVLKNLKGGVNGKIAFTAPLIFARSKKSRIGCDFENIANATGLKVCEGFPIPEFRDRSGAKSIVGRSIVVMER